MFAQSALRFRTEAIHRALVEALVLAAVCWGTAPAAAQTSPAAKKSANVAIVNLQHTLLVRKALMQDKELVPLNLGVTVENRVATLWGPVPSGHLLAKAVNAAKAVPDILEVRSFLYVDDMMFPEAQYLPEPGSVWSAPLPLLNPPPPPPVKKTSEVSQNFGSLVPLDMGKTTSGSKSGSPWQAVVTEKAAATEKNTSYKASPSDTPGLAENQGLFVLPPIAIPTFSGGDAPAEVPLAVTLKDRVVKLQTSDPRFYWLQILVEENRVYLNGSAYQWGDVQQLAKAIAQLPGVGNVIIGPVQIKLQK